MVELTQKERLQPSLLDRLTDDEPEKTQESREQRAFPLSKLRGCVLRDLVWLLNTSKLESVQSLDDYSLAAHSVINYGIPNLTGSTDSGINVSAIEQSIKQAIWDFEPRILPDSVRVKLSVSDQIMSHHTISFDIDGYLWAQPLPLHLYLKTEVDMELGCISVKEIGG
jgi:type VI secretion system protein ImpF